MLDVEKMFGKEKILQLLNDDTRLVELWQQKFDKAESDLDTIRAKNALHSALCKKYAHKEMLNACGVIVEYKDGIAVDVWSIN